MAEKLRLHQHDNGVKLIMTITKDQIVEPLIGAKVLIKFKDKNTGYEFDRYANVTDPNTGEVEYTFTFEDLAVIGNYITEVETTYQNGVVLSCKNPFILVVQEEVFNRTPK